MSGDLDAWLNSDVAGDVAKAGGPQPVLPSAKADKPSLPKTFGRGGVIRNPATKRVTMLSNPINNPKPPKLAMTKTANPPTPEEDLKAEHPALAIPSIMTGMDMDTVKNGTDPKPEPKQVQTGQPLPVSYDSTLRDLLMLAFNAGGVLHFGTNEFVLSIQITAPVSKSQE